MTRDVATQILSMCDVATKQLHGVLRDLEPLDDASRAWCRKQVGLIAGQLFAGVMERLRWQYPDLDPTDPGAGE
jgi:hypothetical protein